MDYQKIYNELIAKRQADVPSGYTERHHVIPKSLGGTDDPENLVYLTLREHFLAHRLLAKTTTGVDNIKMWDAVWGMLNRTKMVISSRTYLSLREGFSQAASIRAKQQWMDGKATPPPNHTGVPWWNNGTKSKRQLTCPGDGWVEGRVPANKKQWVPTYVNGVLFNTGKEAADHIGCVNSVITNWRDKGKPFKGEFFITSTPN